MKEIFGKFASVMYELVKRKPLSASPAYNPEKIETIVTTVAENIAIAVVIVIVARIVRSKAKSWFIKVALILTAVDLFLFSKGNLITFPLDLVSEPLPVAEWLKERAGFDRYLSTAGSMPYTGLGVYWTHLRSREPFSPNKLTAAELSNFSGFQKELMAVPENQGMPYRLFDTGGYAAVVPAPYLKFWSQDQSPNAISIENLSDVRLDETSTKYVIAGYPLDPVETTQNKKFRLIYNLGETKVYENTQAVPRVFLVEDGEFASAIKSYTPTKISIETNSDRDAKLVLTDNDYPGWTALIDGQRVPINRYRNLFRMVDLPQGSHIVEFRFHPKSLKVGAIISLAGVVWLVAEMVWRRRKSRLSSLTSTARRIHSNA